MTIIFSGAYGINVNFGITFQAIVDGKSVSCHITQEALQDINPENRFNSATQQFESHKFKFQDVARRKIMNGEINNNQVYITTSDILSF
ncbi:hypothetical protein D3C78_272950 [compost metagenome]